MRFKSITLLLIVALVATFMVGCGTTDDSESDTETTASIVNEGEAFKNAISKDGTWIICTIADISIDDDLVLEGDFYDKDDSSKELYRKVALYAQDEDRNVTERYSLTAPKLTVKSPNAKIQGGTFVGDVYVESNGFILQDAKIEGNLYFTKDEYKNSFELKDGATVTGETKVTSESDVETTASIVNEAEAFKNAISKDGTWIICTIADISIDDDLVLEGEFYDKDDSSKELYRKVALYAQDEDRNVTERYSLTAPKLTVKSPNAKIQGGTFVGDVYVESNGFILQDAKIEGNLYFTKEEYKNSSELKDGATVTGKNEVKE